MAHDTLASSDVGSDEITAAIDELVATMPDDPVMQRGRQYDLGLAWVHHPRAAAGWARPGRQLDVARRVQDAGRGAG